MTDEQTPPLTETEAVDLAKEYSLKKLGWSKHVWDVTIVKVAQGDVWNVRFEQAFRTIIFSIDPNRKVVTMHTTELR